MTEARVGNRFARSASRWVGLVDGSFGHALRGASPLTDPVSRFPIVATAQQPSSLIRIPLGALRRALPTPAASASGPRSARAVRREACRPRSYSLIVRCDTPKSTRLAAQCLMCLSRSVQARYGNRARSLATCTPRHSLTARVAGRFDLVFNSGRSWRRARRRSRS